MVTKFKQEEKKRKAPPNIFSRQDYYKRDHKDDQNDFNNFGNGPRFIF